MTQSLVGIEGEDGTGVRVSVCAYVCVSVCVDPYGILVQDRVLYTYLHYTQ